MLLTSVILATITVSIAQCAAVNPPPDHVKFYDLPTAEAKDLDPFVSCTNVTVPFCYELPLEHLPPPTDKNTLLQLQAKMGDLTFFIGLRSEFAKEEWKYNCWKSTFLVPRHLRTADNYKLQLYRGESSGPNEFATSNEFRIVNKAALVKK